MAIPRPAAGPGNENGRQPRGKYLARPRRSKNSQLRAQRRNYTGFLGPPGSRRRLKRTRALVKRNAVG
jgi:hypothetical protein